MKIVLYADADNTTANQIELLIQAKLSDIKVERVQSLESLLAKLRKPLHGFSVVLAYVVSGLDMERLATVKLLFDNVRLILVLPGREQEQTILGLKLNPCFMSYQDSAPEDALSVLETIGRRQKGIKGWDAGET